MLTLSGTHDFTPFGEFMISPIHYNIHYIILNLSALGLCLRINNSGLFAWISPTALSRTFSINKCGNNFLNVHMTILLDVHYHPNNEQLNFEIDTILSYITNAQHINNTNMFIGTDMMYFLKISYKLKLYLNLISLAKDILILVKWSRCDT